jgi:hypothetical protein
LRIGRAIFLVLQQEAGDLLRESAIFIFSSKIEVFSVSLLEAMAAGLVCVAILRVEHKKAMVKIKPGLAFHLLRSRPEAAFSYFLSYCLFSQV